MARAIKQGQHIFIAFQDGEAVLDSQLRPRMYKSREQFEKSFPAWRDGKAELVEYAPTLTPPNEWVNRVRELDELYTKLQIVTGFTAEQLLEIFAAGYTLEKPDYSKKFAEMENLAEAAQPNEPLTLEQLREMDGVNALWVHNLAWGLHKPRFMLVHSVSEDWWTCCDFDGFETFCADDYGERYLLYRRPPEVSP